MGSKRANKISEEWEDIGKDNFSVVSFSSSDEECLLGGKDGDDEPIVPAPKNERRNGQQATQSGTFTWVAQVDVDANSEPQAQSIIRNSMNKIEAAPSPPYLPSKETQSETKEANSPASPDSIEPEDPFEDPLEVEDEGVDRDEIVAEFFGDEEAANPKFLLKALESLSQILKDAVLATLELRRGSRGRDMCESACGLLIVQVSELVPIIKGYCRIWPSASRVPPIDLGLHNWLSRVRVKALGLQAEVKSLARKQVNPVDADYHLIQIWRDLESSAKQMNDFLPIMQADFNEYQTERMNLPMAQSNPAFPAVQSTSSDVYSGRRWSSDVYDNRPSNPIWRLRQQLYNLKDNIQRAVQVLSYCQQPIRANDIMEELSSPSLPLEALEQTYRKLHGAVTRIVSNNGSEWIESGLAGDMTYAEFAEMDASCLQDLTDQLRAKLDVIAPDPFVPRPGIFVTPDQFDWLDTFSQVLLGTLCPRHK